MTFPTSSLFCSREPEAEETRRKPSILLSWLQNPQKSQTLWGGASRLNCDKFGTAARPWKRRLQERGVDLIDLRFLQGH